MPVNPIDNNMEILLGSLNQQSPINQNTPANTGFTGVFDTVSASFLAQQFNDLHEIVRESGDEAAMEGLRSVAAHMAMNPDSTQAVDFAQAMEGLANAEDGDIAEFFASAQEIISQNHGFQPWFDTFLNLESTDLQQSFLSATQDILSSEEGEIGEAFSQFVQNVSQIISESPDEDMLSENLQNFFQGLDQQDNLNDRQTFMERFFEEFI